MKTSLIIILIALSLNAFSQDAYIAKWTSGLGFTEVQQSSDRITFTTIGSTTVDSFKVSGPTYYYRVKTNGVYSNIVRVTPDVIIYNVIISNLLYSRSSWYDNLSWITFNVNTVRLLYN